MKSQKASFRDNLYEMSKPTFRDNGIMFEPTINLSSAEFSFL